MPARFPEAGLIGQEGVRNNQHRNGNGYHDIGHEEIVITGLSGRLPESNTIEEFKQNLYANVDLVTDDERRWPAGNFLFFYFLNIVENQ